MNYPTEIADIPIEAPQLVYPKGPLRAIAHFKAVVDQIAGEVVLVTLSPCGHEATLVGPNLTNKARVRCSVCFHKKYAAGETVIEAGEDGGRKG